jgi:CheY-like chemotaxis protein
VITVAVVDDQSLIRVGLRTILEAEDDIDLVGEAADGRAALRLVRDQRPDVVLLDIRMPTYDGLAVLRDISADPDLESVHAIMLTTFELDEYVFQALRAGASGFLLKDGDPADLLRAIRTVAKGGSLLAPSVTPPGDRGIRRPGGSETGSAPFHRPSYRTGARDRGLGGHRPIQRRDRRRAVPQSRDRAYPHRPSHDQAPRPRSCSTGRLRDAIRTDG